jgi:hypothetical protein
MACHPHAFLENPRPESAQFVPSLTRLCCEQMEIATLLPRQAAEERLQTAEENTPGDHYG